MASTSKKELKRRDRAYYRRRQQNHVFAAIAQLFAEEAEKGEISKKELAELLGRDPSQITRWLSAPSNFELDTISDILLALGAEMDHRVVRFAERAKSNIAHPLIAPYLVQAPQDVKIYVSPAYYGRTPAQVRPITATASSTNGTFEVFETLKPAP